MADKIEGDLEVGISVVIDLPSTPEYPIGRHVVFSPNQARSLAVLLVQKAYAIEQVNEKPQKVNSVDPDSSPEACLRWYLSRHVSDALIPFDPDHCRFGTTGPYFGVPDFVAAFTSGKVTEEEMLDIVIKDVQHTCAVLRARQA